MSATTLPSAPLPGNRRAIDAVDCLGDHGVEIRV
ncbi:MAG: hypothetical protein ACI86S_001254, partial [Paracoccaceae bacterium]